MKQSRPRILIVEDDDSILLGLRMNLESEGYAVEHASDGQSGLQRSQDESWDLIILDVMLPKMNGYDLLARLNRSQSRPPVLMLTARSEDMDKVAGLDLGAEDYVTKPFSIAELLARIRAILRRHGTTKAETVLFGDVHVDLSTRTVMKQDQPVDLTATEFDVLALLLNARGRILSRQQMLDSIHGQGHHGTLRTIDNFIAQLRSKLEDDPGKPRHLLTVRGVGYRLATSD